jgi:hypothetical protein
MAELLITQCDHKRTNRPSRKVTVPQELDREQHHRERGGWGKVCEPALGQEKKRVGGGTDSVTRCGSGAGTRTSGGTPRAVNNWHIHESVSRTIGTCSVSIKTTPHPDLTTASGVLGDVDVTHVPYT